MKIKIKKEVYIFSIITLLFFGVFCLLQYAPDTYSVFANDLRHTVKHFFSYGRFVTGVATYFAMGILKLGNRGTYLLSYLFAMVCMIVSLYRLNELIKRDIKNDNISILISTLMLINPFSIELFIYIEKGIMLLAVLLCVLAVEQIDKFFQGNKKSIFISLFFMLVANCCYQGIVGLFVAISLIYIIKYSKNIKEFIVNNVLVALVYGIPAIMNFLSVKFLFSNARVNGNIIFSETLAKVIDGTKSMIINAYGLLPEYLLLISIIGILVLIIYKAIVKENSAKNKALEILGAFYIIAGTLFATIAPQIMQDTNSIWFVARSSYPMAAIVGILALYLFMNYEIKDIEKKVISVLAIIFLLVQLTYFMRYAVDNYIGNYIDKTITLEINNKIQEYEEQTGNTIDSISVYKDSIIQYFYPELKASGDINVKAYASDWCVPQIIRLYTNRELKLVENDETIKEKFEQKNWDYFDEEQLVFEGNTLHLCTF